MDMEQSLRLVVDATPPLPFLQPAAEHCHCSFVGTQFSPAEDRRLSWLGWLVTFQDGIPANGHPSQQ